MMQNRKDITKIVEQNLCNSCGTCLASCGPNSIQFSVTSGGHLFPIINYDTCTDCELCLNICPGDHFLKGLDLDENIDPFVGKIKNTYVGKAVNKDIYNNSQSGGAVTAILKYLFETSQISAAVVTIDNTNSSSFSQAIIIYNSNELHQSQKSKYTPTDVVSLIPKIARIEGKVAMVGVSCHFHGLENLSLYRKKLKNKIIKIGLVCDRVMTHTSVDFFTQLATKEKVKKFIFRNKTLTGYPGDMTITTNTNKTHILSKEIRWKMKDYFTPARCRLCFDKMNIYADIVVGDPHGVKNTNQISGESLIISRTEIGEDIIKNATDKNYINIRLVDEKQVISGQNINKKRAQWLSYITAWEELGKKIPEYPKSVLNFAKKPNKKETKAAKKQLIHALSLDNPQSKNEAIKNAMSYYKISLYKERFLLPLRLLKVLFKKLL